MDDTQRDKKLALLKNQVEMLKQSFDTIHIFATKYNDGQEETTSVFNYGSGNWFARYGQIKEFIVREEESFRSNE